MDYSKKPGANAQDAAERDTIRMRGAIDVYFTEIEKNQTDPSQPDDLYVMQNSGETIVGHEELLKNLALAFSSLREYRADLVQKITTIESDEAIHSLRGLRDNLYSLEEIIFENEGPTPDDRKLGEAIGHVLSAGYSSGIFDELARQLSQEKSSLSIS